MKIGIDLGGSHIAVGVVDEKGKIVEKYEEDLRNKNINDIISFLKKYLEINITKIIKKYEIEVIGIATPGTPREGKITSLVNLGIEEFNITKVIKEICDLPIYIRNDAKCAALAEKKYGNLKQYQDAVFICLGTGIGGAVFVNDKLLVPKRNPGFELGHMIIEKGGNLCNCGKKGCFETYCSIKRFKNRIIDELKLEKDIEPQKLILELQKRKNEENIKEIIEEYIDNLIIGISNIIDIFESEAICFGGSFIYFESILFEKLIEKYYEKRYVFNKENLPKLTLAKLGNDAGIIGTIEKCE